MAASQRNVLQLYNSMMLQEPHWAGKLLLAIGLEDAGRELAMAALAAGAVALIVEPDAVLVRQANREGCTTFTVTSVDEALRTLKNEVRRGRAVAVALNADLQLSLDEMLDRGVLPDYVAAEAAEHASLHRLLQQGSRLLVAAPLSSDELDEATTMAVRRQQDLALLQETGRSAAQQRWLRVAPTLFPRDLTRFY